MAHWFWFSSCCISRSFHRAWAGVLDAGARDFPSDVRGAAMRFRCCWQWVANAVVVLLFPYAFHVIGKAITLGFWR